MRSPVSAPSDMRPQDYERALRVLERCAPIDTVECLQEELLEALGSAYGCTHTAFFRTDVFTRTHADPDPVLNGRLSRIIDEYRTRWHDDDVMFTAASMRRIRRSGVSALSQLRPRRVPPEARAYLEDFVFRAGFRSVCALDLDLPGSQRGVVGIFGEAHDHLDVADLGGLAVIVRQLSAISGRLTPTSSWNPGTVVEGLSPRLAQIADLVGRGWSNGSIAGETGLTLDTVKKYISQVLARTGCRNRTELALLVAGSRPDVASSPSSPVAAGT